MPTMAEAFAALPEPTQIAMINQYLGNQMFELASQVNDAMTPEVEMEMLVSVVEIESGALASALPQEERTKLQGTCQMLRDLINAQ